MPTSLLYHIKEQDKRLRGCARHGLGHTTMKKTLVTLMLGMVSIVGLAQNMQRCVACSGYGGVVCPTCQGNGQIPVYNPYYGCYVPQICPRCAGYKAVVCGHCGGRGVVMVSNSNISFGSKRATPPNGNSDGYIYQGKNINVNGRSYKYYKKDCHDYYWDGNKYVQITLK